MWKIHIDFRKKEVSVKIELGARGVNTYRYAGAYRNHHRDDSTKYSKGTEVGQMPFH